MSVSHDLSSARWPRRAVVTAGMPYGNKPLHFGHIGGVFIPADTFARFLRDRIGAENVRFVSGTDCFGSPIDEGYRKQVEEGFTGSIADYVVANHEAQAEILKRFQISLDIYEGSGLGHAGDVHQMISDTIIRNLYANGWLVKRSSLQFFDEQAQVFLNGRQVEGRCPFQGCKSEHAYADECDRGHQYEPIELIAPKSTVTGTTPIMKPVENWYFDLPAFHDYLEAHTVALEASGKARPVVIQSVREFLEPPIIYIKNEAEADYHALAPTLPAHHFRPAVAGRQSFEIEFATIDERDEARELLAAAHIRFRTSKTLVPFRITGNIAWGVKAPVLEDLEHLTVWCWPESLWAPISFSVTVNDHLGYPRKKWEDFWCSDDAEVYQFIGQDNIYFYGVAQPAMFEALNRSRHGEATRANGLRQTRLVANHHLLFGKTKASSSGAIKPPSGEDLLEHYTAEQLRAHFLALGLDQRSVGFSPKPFDPVVEHRDDPRRADPVLKEGTLLTNVFNRLARSCFYEAQKSFNGTLPLGMPSETAREAAQDALKRYDETMAEINLHAIMALMDDFIRFANKHWTSGIACATNENNDEARRQVLCDSFYLLRVVCLLMHPIVPVGTELICDHLDFDPEDFFSWNYDFESNEELCSATEIDQGFKRIRPIPPKFDFFPKHSSQR